MTLTPRNLCNLPETPSQTAGPYVHIGLIPHQAGFDIYENPFGHVVEILREPGKFIFAAQRNRPDASGKISGRQLVGGFTKFEDR